MPEFTCPKCGAPMVLKTARRGPRAGREFYGCSRFPTCRGTVPFESAIPHEAPETQRHSAVGVSFPRRLFARSRFQTHQVRFLESVAVPGGLLELDGFDDVEEETLRAFSQWRVDFPLRDSETSLNDRQRQIISVLEKILTRGRITLSSPHLEKEFAEMFLGPTQTMPPLALLRCLALRGSKRSGKDFWWDSTEETIFYNRFLAEFLGQGYEQFVVPQVEIMSLLPPHCATDSSGGQRVDFAVFHPRIDHGVIVEIDGAQHKDHVESDRERDSLLQKHGYTVVRIPAEEIQNGSGPSLLDLEAKIRLSGEDPDDNLTILHDEWTKLLQSTKLGHQIQLVLLQALQSNFLSTEDIGSWRIISDLDELDIFDEETSLCILQESVTDFVQLLSKLSELYGVRIEEKEPWCNLLNDNSAKEAGKAICISFSGAPTGNAQAFHVQNIYFPFRIANSSFPAPPVVGGLDAPREDQLEYFLRYFFRKPSFWEGQYDGVTRVLEGKDTLLLLPTGAGKSLVYQLASLLLPGRTLAIDPIISLMQDQVDNLKLLGVDRCIAITGELATEDREIAVRLLGQGEYLFAFVSPERFQIDSFRQSLRALTVHTPVTLIVVDEAHCVSEWGHDFRTAYLNVGRTSRRYCESVGYIPPLLGLTGTASRAVLKDVQRELRIEEFDAIITPKSFDRPELKFHVLFSASREKSSRLSGYLGQKLPGLFNTRSGTLYQTREKDTFSGLLFCPFVGSEFGVVHLSDKITSELGIPTAYYSGGSPKFFKKNEYGAIKSRVARLYKTNKIPLLVCTKAFGMGIDKPNIRYTIHYGVPQSIESFYQEVGRAGRDRRPAHCCIIVSIDYPERAKRLLDPNAKVEEISSVLKDISWEENDDITRALYFQTNAFRGVTAELKDIEEIIDILEPISRKRRLSFARRLSSVKNVKSSEADGENRKRIEKALHRLLLIGVVSDYTIKYSTSEFTVQLSGKTNEEIVEAYGGYIASYLSSMGEKEVKAASRFLDLPATDFTKGVIGLLLQFIYNVIERGRRRALNEMWLACTDSSTDIRQRILRYLEATEYSEALDGVIADADAGLRKSKDVLGAVRSTNEAAELRGQVSRYLESYPDHPGLLMLRAMAEVFSRERNHEVVEQNFVASISSALDNYSLSNTVVFEFGVWGISNINKRDPELANQLVAGLLENHPDRDLARALIAELPIDLVGTAAWYLLSQIQWDCDSLVVAKGD